MKRLIALLILFSISAPSFAAIGTPMQEQVLARQHLFAEKDAQSDSVVVTNMRNVVCKGNVFNVVFDCKLWSEKAAAGQKIMFSFPEAVYTQEGTLVIPACTKISATLIKIQKQCKFNKNARIGDKNNLRYAPTYDKTLGHVGQTWVGCPYIEQVQSGEITSYKLRFLRE